MSNAVKPIAAITGGLGAMLGFQKSPSVSTSTAAQVNTDDAINQADELLRQRQRQGVNANLSNGTAGSANVAASSSGQKTLLGG